MKPKPDQNPGSKWEGKGVNVSKKTSRSQAQQKSSVSFSAQLKPLAGKVFYLDLQSNRTAETLESDIKLLGGTVEKFFSKEIKYLVSNKREAKHVHRLRQDSPVPSPDSGQSSPQPNLHSPSNRVDSVKSRSPGQVDKSIKSRGKSLVERVVKEQGRVQMDRILSNALEWGVKIFFLDDVLAYIQKKKEVFGNQVSAAASVKSQVKSRSSAKLGFQKRKAGRIAKPFIKVEDSSRHYCPLYLTMPNLPEFNLTTAAPYSPFCVEEKASGVKQQGHRGVKASAAEETGQGRKRSREKKKRGGFCECCMVKYDQIKTHLQSERHTAFSRSDEYSVVDRLVSSLHFNFLPLKTKTTRPKCIVSSTLLAPGSCGEADPSIGGDARNSEITKAEEDRILDGSERSHPEQRFCAKADQRSCYTYSDGSKHRFLAYKQTATQKAEQIVKSENPHSDGEFLSRDNRVGFVDKIPHKDTNDSVSYLLGTNLQSDASASNFSVVADGPEDANKEAVLSEAVQEAKVSSKTGNKLSEKEDEMPIFSRVQTIQRKIKVYKRKRRKVDPIVESAGPELENSVLKLWEIFQSSDDMDVEFRGFAD
ncbi:protein DBF4 homolog A isoform X1 [Fundulus heteroclitus]|uniref:protein DBF4 homolog A isoform X1 n=1 Tax=Fundulus heteroclitus TaxID=8078 RepID=UPI00165BADFD|nr:protein DBF4 homolog A isoform X1 [Fundulus heteroclitus]XP_035989756.1 protein DBF4 homolog A isoform X1 [Fundulus heteroclitus]